MAFDALQAISRAETIPFSIEFVPSKNLYRVRCMNKQFLAGEIYKAMEDCIKFVAVATGYARKEMFEATPSNPYRTETGELMVAYSIDRIKTLKQQ